MALESDDPLLLLLLEALLHGRLTIRLHGQLWPHRAVSSVAQLTIDGET